jgi:hypothetical protein
MYVALESCIRGYQDEQPRSKRDRLFLISQLLRRRVPLIQYLMYSGCTVQVSKCDSIWGSYHRIPRISHPVDKKLVGQLRGSTSESTTQEMNNPSGLL